jgi:hypothetical protein
MSVTSAFEAASAVERIGEHHFRVHIPDGWQQGRGAFGGLVLATLLRAIESDEIDPRRVVRSLAGDVCGPVLPGAADIRVRVLRRGNNQSNVSAELSQGGSSGVLAVATAILSGPRTANHHAGFLSPPPPAADWQSIPALPIGAMGPTFAQHYEYRDAGSTASSIQAWIRERQPPARLDAATLVGRLDAWWPTLFQIEGPRPCATVSFTAELLADPNTLAADEPLRYQAKLAGMNDGFFVELRELWQDGRPIALNQQTFAILK